MGFPQLLLDDSPRFIKYSAILTRQMSPGDRDAGGVLAGLRAGGCAGDLARASWSCPEGCAPVDMPVAASLVGFARLPTGDGPLGAAEAGLLASGGDAPASAPTPRRGLLTSREHAASSAPCWSSWSLFGRRIARLSAGSPRDRLTDSVLLTGRVDGAVALRRPTLARRPGLGRMDSCVAP